MAATRIAHTRSRELFILAVVAIALGTAVGSAELFGVSLALGAFLAGVVLGESNLSHQVGADVLAFPRDVCRCYSSWQLGCWSTSSISSRTRGTCWRSWC